MDLSQFEAQPLIRLCGRCGRDIFPYGDFFQTLIMPDPIDEYRVVCADCRVQELVEFERDGYPLPVGQWAFPESRWEQVGTYMDEDDYEWQVRRSLDSGHCTLWGCKPIPKERWHLYIDSDD